MKIFITSEGTLQQERKMFTDQSLIVNGSNWEEPPSEHTEWSTWTHQAFTMYLLGLVLHL
jgi:hypothetical protein